MSGTLFDPWTVRDLGPAFDPLTQAARFDPETATPEALLALHLPPRPDRDHEPVLHAHWRDLVAGAETPTVGLVRNTPRAQAGADRSLRRRPCQRSLNWAGAIAPAHAGRRFTRIGGRWTIPDLAGVPPAKGLSLVSAWVGLGGATRASQSMPQLGSEQGWDDGKPLHRLWCQWWLGRDEDGFLSSNLTLPLQPGDEILCSLLVLGPRRVLCHIRRIPKAGGAHQLVAIEGNGKHDIVASSAEWIMERPRAVLSDPVADQQVPSRQLGQRRGLKSGTLLDMPTIDPAPPARDPTAPRRFRITQASARLGEAKETPRREITPARAALVAMMARDTGPARLREAIRPALRRDGPETAVEFRIRRVRRDAAATVP